MNSVNRKIPLLKIGDKYIHFTKYGGINTGTITQIIPTTVLQLTHEENYTFTKWSIINDNGLLLELDGTDGQIYKLK